MPHQCTTCGRTFPDGSKEMLGGCPGCGGNKFQFLPPGAEAAPATETPDDGDDDIIVADEEPVAAPGEDAAQASARRELVGEDDLPAADSPTPDIEDAEAPDLAELRAELDDQFESIKILEPGQYELNLMELYDREEYIVALEEDGRYVIDVPSEPRS